MGGTVFFDYDGTLHDSMRLYGPAFRHVYAALVAEGWAKPRAFSDEEIASWLGYSPASMWAAFMPDLPEAVWRSASGAVGEEMRRLLAEGAGCLYPGATTMLKSLREKGFCLVFLSNCSRAYRNEHLAAFELEDLFDGTWCAEDFEGLEKWQIYQRVAARYPQPHVMVGDRHHDQEVALRAGIPFVGCTYGFGAAGELKKADALVGAPADITEAVTVLAGRAQTAPQSSSDAPRR